MLATLALVASVQAKIPLYSPTGPTIRVTMASGKSFDIRTDPAHSPKTVAQILMLCYKKFYDRQRIHRVEYWVVQWGAPASKDQPLKTIDKKTGKLDINPAVGDGGYGKLLPFEMCDVDFKRGVVGIASDGLQMGGDSQLFILTGDRDYLYHSYAVVGKVVTGMDVVDHIKFGDRIQSMRELSRVGFDYPIRIKLRSAKPNRRRSGAG